MSLLTGRNRIGTFLAAALALTTPAFAAEGPRKSVFRLLAPRFRQPSAEELKLFTEELAGNGLTAVEYARIPIGFVETDGIIQPSVIRTAALYGDLDGDRRPEWILGCYAAPRLSVGPGPRETLQVPARMPVAPGLEDRARIVVFRKNDRGRWLLHWVSPGLGFQFSAPEFNLREVQDGLDDQENLRPPLSLVDVDRDGRPEIAYHCWGESPETGALSGIFRQDGARWISIAPQADRFSIRDLDQDGKLEVITASQYIGYGMGDDDVPHVWRWNGRQYMESSREFPRYYAGLLTRYQEYVERIQALGARYDRDAWQRAILKAASLAG